MKSHALPGLQSYAPHEVCKSGVRPQTIEDRFHLHPDKVRVTLLKRLLKVCKGLIIFSQPYIDERYEIRRNVALPGQLLQLVE